MEHANSVDVASDLISIARCRELMGDEAEGLSDQDVDLIRRYDQLTSALSDRVHADLAWHLEVPIVLHLAKAGLSEWLERKLRGEHGALRALVEEQHERPGVR
jgi:hypothetical protein